MKIQVITQPDRKITQSVLFFQFRFMGWSEEEMVSQDDRYGSLPFGYVIAYEGSEIIGAVNILKRNIFINNKPIKMGGIGGVCIHKDHRRKGVASALLRKAMEALKNEQCDIAFLCTDLESLEKLYAKVGFVPLGRQYVATGLAGKKYYDMNGMIASLNSKEIFEEIKNDSKIFDLQGQDW